MMTNDELWKKYLNQIKRINKFIDTQTKLGFKFPESIVPETPKKITEKSVERLQKITPTKLYEQATYKVPETGEIVSGIVGKKMEMFRQSKAKESATNKKMRGKSISKTGYTSPPTQTAVTLQNVREMINSWTPLSNWSKNLTEFKEKDKTTLEKILDGAIAKDGERLVAQRLEENSNEVQTIVQEILYGSGSKEGNFKDGRTQVNFDLTRFSAIVMGRALTVEESIDLTEEVENMEVDN